MEIIRSIHAATAKGGQNFILIGGHALNFQGISRSTGDIDLMVERSDSPFWRSLLISLGYNIFHETPAFIQSKPPLLAAWPIDLMLVSAETIQKASSEATTTEIFGPPIKVASIGSLIAMKLHALKYVDPVRALKDQSDLMELLKLAGISPASEQFRQLCIKYATLVIHERLSEFKQ
jgi:hypothetical protein